jgi:hypothetical protein
MKSLPMNDLRVVADYAKSKPSRSRPAIRKSIHLIRPSGGGSPIETPLQHAIR